MNTKPKHVFSLESHIWFSLSINSLFHFFTLWETIVKFWIYLQIIIILIFHLLVCVFFSLPSLFIHYFFGRVVHICILLPLFKFHFGPPSKKKVLLWSKSFHIYICLFIPSLIGKLHLKLLREEILFQIDHIGHNPFFMIYNHFGKKTIKASIIGLLLT